MANRNDGDARVELARGLEGVLADSYVLYNATQSCHWNVTGPSFVALHGLFEDQYSELASAIDDIAEQIRTLGFYTRGTLSELLDKTGVQQRPDLREAPDMLAHLIACHERLVERLRDVQGTAESLGDEGTFDLLVERMRVHEKAIWMLKAQAGAEFESLRSLSEASRSAA